MPDPRETQRFSTVVVDRNGVMLRAFISADEQWKMPYEKSDEIPKKLIQATLCYEDEWFYYHPGVNPTALVRAFILNRKAHKVVSGGSTVTMQLARILHPKKRSYANKAIEIAQALKIEMHYSKREIIRSYLMHAPYGGNVIGYKAASIRYFGKLPDELSWAEAAMLAVLPNAPGLISPVSNRELLIDKRDRLLDKMRDKGIIDDDTCRMAKKETVPDTFHRMPVIAAHITEKLKQNVPGSVIRTSIDADIQRDVEASIKQHMLIMRSRGINNCSVIIADTKTGEVVAYAGSQDYFDTVHDGQVDGVVAARSAGSTLKPFLYALSMDAGIILPQTQLKDVPVYYGSYAPENADQRFNGLVTAKEALIRSLNVPAVNLLQEYGVNNFYMFLKSAGIKTLFRPSDDYGLTLIIGGAEIRPWDLAMLFRGLGNEGRFSPLTIMRSDTATISSSSVELISPGACYLTLSMLREVKRPDSEYYWELYQNQWPLAWKTGTSYGQRDAWAAGVSPQWTIVVWVGNFTGESNRNISGAQCAGPLLFDIFSSLPRDRSTGWFKRPNDLYMVQLCADTGYAAGRWCPQTITVQSPKHAHELQVCPYHSVIYTTLDGRYEVCSLCWQEGAYKPTSFLQYPSEIVQYLRDSGHFTGIKPEHNPACAHKFGSGELSLIYPQDNTTLWIPRDYDGSLQSVVLRAAHSGLRETVYWYLDGKLIGQTTDKHSLPVAISRGRHDLVLVDTGGRRCTIQFTAEIRTAEKK